MATPFKMTTDLQIAAESHMSKMIAFFVKSGTAITDGNDLPINASNFETSSQELSLGFANLMKEFNKLKPVSSTAFGVSLSAEESAYIEGKLAERKAKLANALYTRFYDEPRHVQISFMLDSSNNESVQLGGLNIVLTKILQMKDIQIQPYLNAAKTAGITITSEDDTMTYIKTLRTQLSASNSEILKHLATKKPTDLAKIVVELKKFDVLLLFTSKNMASATGAADASGSGSEYGSGAEHLGGGGFIKKGGAGNSYVKRYSDIETIKNTKYAEINSLSGSFPLSLSNKNKIDALQLEIYNLDEEQQKIISGLGFSKRATGTLSGKRGFKINEEEYLINQAVNAIKSGLPYEIARPGRLPISVNKFSDLRKFIMQETSDPITLLLRLTNLNPISLDDMLPKITEDKFTIKRDDRGILIVKDSNDESIEMPNPLGNKSNRQEYSKKFKANNCYGLGGPATSGTFCVSLLDKCLASDKDSLDECKKLFNSPNWQQLKEEGIKNSNIYLIKEFLLKIGYPRINDKFDPSIDSWFKVIVNRYDINDQAMLQNIKSNEPLKEVISDIVTKYNKIIQAEKSNRLVSGHPLKFHLPMKGGDSDFHSLLNTNLYELNGGANENVTQLSGILSPSERIYKIFKDLVKDQNITSAYRNFFDKMEKNIENNNKNIDSGVRQNFNVLLQSFKESEEKLNKLLQTMHNFAWFLGKQDSSVNLTEEQKKLNEEAVIKLDQALNNENLEAYNAAREKLVNSLNKKSHKIISIAAGHPMVLIGI